MAEYKMKQTEIIDGVKYILDDDGQHRDMKTGRIVSPFFDSPSYMDDPELSRPNPIGHNDAPAIDKKKVAPEQGGILSGLRSFTSPIFSGAKDLFNDPKRMALISGGLRMADPNSYYDKQGFYSPWSGINAGLGTGIKTYKSLSEPRKLGFKKQEEIKHANAMALLQEKNRLGIGTGGGEYRKLMKEYFTLEDGNPRKAMLKSRIDYLSTRETPADIQTWNLIKDMSPEELQKFYGMKRGPKTVNLGGTQAVVDPANPSKLQAEFPVTLKPSETPTHKESVATQTAIGKGVGEDIASARSKLPMMELELAEMTTLADEFINHAGFSDLIGATWKPLAKNIHGTDAAGADSIRKQLEGKLFMKAYQTLKGGGQITEIEGDQAKQAQGRMNIALSEKEYKKALTDFLDAYRRGLEKLKGVAYPVGTNPQRRKGDSKSRRSTDNLTEEETREMETLKLELGK
jgi:hypothetical protein